MMTTNLISTFERIKQDIDNVPIRIEGLYTNEPYNGQSYYFDTAYFDALIINRSVFPTGNYLLETVASGQLMIAHGATGIQYNVKFEAQNSSQSNITNSGVTLIRPNIIRLRPQAAIGTAASATELANTTAPTISAGEAYMFLDSDTGYATYGYGTSKVVVSVTSSNFHRFRVRLYGFTWYDTAYFKLTKIS